MERELQVAREWVREADERTLFLLGAGASKPALPVSAELTEIVLSSIDAVFENWAPDSLVPNLWRDIRPVIDAMGANVEDVYQAIETLTYQATDPTRYWVEEFSEFPSHGGSADDLARDAKVLLHLLERHTLRGA